MLDIGLNTFEEENSSDGIFIIDSEPTYEQLLEINNDLYRELYFMKYAQFEKEVQDGFDMFSNAFVACEYVQQNGFDEHVAQLIGNEGLLTNIKDVLVRFAKWLAGLISKFVNWVMSLFVKTPNISKGSSPKQLSEYACVTLLRGSREERNKVIKDIKAISRSVSTNIKQEGHQDLPGNEASRATSIPTGHQRILSILKMFAQDAEKLNQSKIISSVELINKFTTELISLLDGSYMKVTSYDAAEYVLHASEHIFNMRIDIMILYDKLKKIKPLSQNASEKECEAYIEQVKNILNVDADFSNEKYSEKAKEFKSKVTTLFSVFKKVYTIEHHVIRSMKPTITALYGLSHYHGNTKKFDQLAGAINVRVKIPEDLMNRIRGAWKCKQMTINRLIISSSHVTENRERLYGSSPYAKYNGKYYTSKDIFITYQSFKSKMWLKDWMKEYEESLKKGNIDIKKYYAQVEPDRVKNFLLTIVHEARHIYQIIKNVHTKDLDKNGTDKTHKEYLEFDHEMDARKAAANFEFKDSDIEWCKSLLKSCIEQETKELNKRWTFN